MCPRPGDISSLCNVFKSASGSRKAAEADDGPSANVNAQQEPEDHHSLSGADAHKGVREEGALLLPEGGVPDAPLRYTIFPLFDLCEL